MWRTDTQTHEHLIQIKPSAPKLNAFFKIHKDNEPIRSVINNTHAKSYKVAKHLNKIRVLNTLIELPYTYATKNLKWNSTKLNNVHITSHHRINTLDAKDLYVNLPIQNIINITKFWLNKKQQLNHNNATYLTKVILNQNNFQSDDKYFHPTKGIAMGSPISSNINYLDLTIHRHNNNLSLGIYRKPTLTDITIHFTSNHPLEQKLAAFIFYINRMITPPITEQAKQREWNTILTIAKNNGFPLHIIHNLRNKLIAKTQQTLFTQTQQKKKWIKYTYHIPLIHKITKLFRHTNINIAFRDTNTIYKQLSNKIIQNKISSSGIYKLKCNTCNNSYVGQTGRSIGIRPKEHTLYTKTNNPVSAYALKLIHTYHAASIPFACHAVLQ